MKSSSSSWRLQAAIVAVYWLMLLAGMVLYTAIRIDSVSAVRPIWIGALGGTVLGQIFALRSFRLWVLLAVVFAIVLWFGPHMPRDYGGTELWMAFLPAALCGYWSLGDRASLAAFWFPAMLWMLSILDHTNASAIPDDSGIVLLCGLALLFVLFLRVRESRRVGLWRTVATTPLASPKPLVVLSENPNQHIVRTGWTFAVVALTFGATAWAAPHLWQGESFEGDHIQISQPIALGGLPCCPVIDDYQTTRSRVKEYFDIGRGHDAFDHPPIEGVECRVCNAPEPILAATEAIAWEGGGGYSAPLSAERYPYEPDPFVPGDDTYTPSHRPEVQEQAVQAALDPPVTPGATGATGSPPPIVPPLVGPSPPPPAAEWQGHMDSSQAPHAIDPPQGPRPITSDAPHHPTAAVAPAGSVAKPRAHRPPASASGPAILHWAVILIAGLLLFQAISLALRPLRRLLTLRHLRRPFWDETVDQRVSNSWQLALVGLRDAGWRSASTEAPREFARRVAVDGIEDCATILERARHGLGIDAKDLSEMTAAAETAYRSARGQIGPVARVASWLRWPLR